MNAGANDKASGGRNWKKDDRSTTGKKAVLGVTAGCLAEGKFWIELLPSGDEAGRGGRTNPSRSSGKKVKFIPRGRRERAHG